VIPEKSLRNPRNELEEIGERQMGNFHVNEAYEYVGVQSPLALGYMQSSAYDGQVIPVGPLLRWRVEAGARQRERERFFAAMGAAGKIVVYSPSASFASIFHVAQNPDEVLSSMADLAGVVAGMPGVYLVLRLHPSDAVGRGEIEALLDLPASVVVDDDSVRASFAGALALADVLVSNVSTTAEQALDNGIPVVLYDKWGRYNHLGAPVVEDGGPQALSPAYYVPARAQLGPTLRWVLERHPPGTALPASARARYTYGWDAVEGFYDFVGQMLEARP
jgi:hypothetical protein